MRITIDIPDNKENGFVLDRVLNAVFPDKPIMKHFDDVRQIMEYHTSLDWRTKPYKMVDCHDCKHHGEDIHGENCRFCHDKSLFDAAESEVKK